MRSDIVPGKTFPDYQLPDHAGTLRKLSELQGDDPLILTLSRGHYCPKEHQQHLELASFYPKIAVGYTRIATISTDDHHTLQEFRASVGAQWLLVSIVVMGDIGQPKRRLAPKDSYQACYSGRAIPLRRSQIARSRSCFSTSWAAGRVPFFLR
jgi:hypothetical protein